MTVPENDPNCDEGITGEEHSEDAWGGSIQEDFLEEGTIQLGREEGIVRRSLGHSMVPLSAPPEPRAGRGCH